MAKKEPVIDIVSQIEKIGAKVSSELSDFNPPYYLSTGIFPLDTILSQHGGISPSCIEIYGANSTGKTSLALNLMAEAQKIDLSCFYMNTERAINSSIVKCFKELDASKVKWIDPNNGQSALDIIELIFRIVNRPLVILDSVPACVSAEMMESSAADSHMAIIARMFSNFMPKIKNLIEKSEGILVLLNQIRDNLSPYGAKTIVPGGHAIKFYSDWRIQFKPAEKIKIDSRIVGHRIKCITEKNRFMRPFMEAITTLIYGKGFSLGYDLLDLGLSYGLIKQSGPYLSFKDEKFHGQQKFVDVVESNEKLQKELKSSILEIIQ